MAFRARVLGAAAGGGLPQWNCGCENCGLARSGAIPSLTQSSLAVSADGETWAVLNASPDIREQIAANACLHPTGPRKSPIRSVLLTNGDIDHVAGLLSLREQQPFTLFATGEIHGVLSANPIFDALSAEKVSRQSIEVGTPFDLLEGMEATLFPVPGKVPLYMEAAEVQTDLEGEQTVGVELVCGPERIFYIPGCALVTERLADRIRGADLLFFDGTLWTDDEMQRTGVGTKTGRRMGHISMSGPEGSIAAMAEMGIARKIFVHMNNTNPVLRPVSPERAEAEAAGWRIAQDGMEITL
ncbi:pyrroloquinoline quinone biosynthesis protein PqqB [Amaricoccus macauensis]|uniref:pyrroloquinoline quinone biosynthesis protein PqqB n=1 Tax=Amaricoccus macauensis TaxID=57001 RepID=UPI003C7B68DB